MIAVTGAAGFIGGAIARALDSAGADVLGIDAAAKADLVGSQEFLDKDEFLRRVTRSLPLPAIDAVVHQGACADTTLRDVDFMRRENCTYALAVLRLCLARRIPFLYASSAAVYGRGRSFQEAGARRPALRGRARARPRPPAAPRGSPCHPRRVAASRRRSRAP